jgi:very-short-patch-repair endonuclease
VRRIIPEPYLTYSRRQRKSQNPWETKFWQHLRANRLYGLPFKRQVQFGPFIFDFGCRSKKLFIELDGGQHTDKEVAEKDLLKQKYAESHGYKVLRFWNSDIANSLEGILEIIKKVCSA